jgi:hypothetical protein
MMQVVRRNSPKNALAAFDDLERRVGRLLSLDGEWLRRRAPIRRSTSNIQRP